MTSWFAYQTNYVLRFSKDEVKILMTAASSHYDGFCRAMAQPGGMIYGLANQVALGGPETVEREFTFRELDTLGKILENSVEGSAHLFGQIVGLFERHPLEDFLAEIAQSVVLTENENDREDLANRVVQFMKDSGMKSRRKKRVREPTT